MSAKLLRLVLFGVGCVPATALAQPTKDMQEAPLLNKDADIHKVVMLRAGIGDKTRIGAGFFISKDGRLITAYHNLQGAKNVKVFGTYGQLGNPRLLRFDSTWDLAEIQVDPPEGKTFPFFEQMTQLPDNLDNLEGFLYGHPKGNPFYRTKVEFPKSELQWSKTFSDEKGRPIFAVEDVRLLQMGALNAKGMSGGPVIVPVRVQDKRTYQVIGVFCASEGEDGYNFCWAIPVSRLKDLHLLEKPLTSFEKLPLLTLLGKGTRSVETIANKNEYRGDRGGEFKLYERMQSELETRLKTVRDERKAFGDTVKGVRKEGDKAKLDRLLDMWAPELKAKPLLLMKEIEKFVINTGDLIIEPLFTWVGWEVKYMTEAEKNKWKKDGLDNRLFQKVSHMQSVHKKKVMRLVAEIRDANDNFAEAHAQYEKAGAKGTANQADSVVSLLHQASERMCDPFEDCLESNLEANRAILEVCRVVGRIKGYDE